MELEITILSEETRPWIAGVSSFFSGLMLAFNLYDLCFVWETHRGQKLVSFTIRGQKYPF